MWWVLIGGAAAIFALVMVLLVLAFRARHPGVGHPADGTDAADLARADLAREDLARAERRWLGGMGLTFSLVVLGALTAYGLVVGERLMPRPHDDLVTVRAEGRQWEWRFGYADAPGRETRDVLHIPAGRPVDVEITTADVIHSFWVPRLAGKLDAIPGHVNVLRIEADGPGEFKGVSAEFNGTGYLAHRFRVIAHDPAGWQQFLAGATE